MFTVLIVDDEPMAREAIKLAADWEAYGFRIAGECDNGGEALALAARIRPDLILTDIKMPDMDGLALAQRVKEDTGGDTVMVLVSGYDEFAYAKQALRSGIRHYLLKPVFEEDLTEMLLDVLSELERREELKKIAAESEETALYMFFEEVLSGRTDHGDIHIPPPLRPYADADWTYASLCLTPGPGDSASGCPAGFPGMGYDALKKTVAPYQTGDIRLFTVFHDTGLYGLILCGGDGTLWQDLAGGLRDLYGERFYLALGDPVRDPRLLHRSMGESEIALEHRFFYPGGSVLTYREIKDRSLSYSFKGIRYMEDFIEALENLDRDRIETSITEMFDAFRQSYMAPEIVKMYIVNIVYRSFGILGEMGGMAENSLSGGTGMLLGANPGLIEMESMLREYAEWFRSYALSLRGRDSLSLMSRVEAYIRDNYRRSLTIKEIAREFYIHPTYLGSQINKWFGCGFIEYLHTMRMKEAANLLSGTDMRVHEIAAELGYHTYSSFLEQFVRFFSMKPTEYRKNM